jgi:hypothetical protein
LPALQQYRTGYRLIAANVANGIADLGKLALDKKERV